jgi:hypothetical protein
VFLGASGGEFRSRSGIVVAEIPHLAPVKADVAGPALGKERINRWLPEFFARLSAIVSGVVLDCALGFANGLLSATLCLLRSAFCAQPIVVDSLTGVLLDLPGGFIGIVFGLVGLASHWILFRGWRQALAELSRGSTRAVWRSRSQLRPVLPTLLPAPVDGRLSHERNPKQATCGDDGCQHPNHSEPLRIGVAPRSNFVSVRHLFPSSHRESSILLRRKSISQQLQPGDTRAQGL